MIGAASLSKFRAIACLSTARKILGNIWMRMLPVLVFLSFQTGFVKGCQAADGVYVANRAAEISREWGLKVYAVQIDLKKAFDRVLHSAVLRAVALQGASAHCIAVLAALLQKGVVRIRLGPVVTEAIPMDRGVPQGAPESPTLFILVVEMILRGLQVVWHARGSGWICEQMHLTNVCFADDVILFSSCREDVTRMLAETVAAFKTVGLDVGMEKTHWTCWPSEEGITIGIDGVGVAWEPYLTFVGGVLDFNGNSGNAIDHRIAQAEKTYHKWKPLLTSRWVSQKRRAELAVRAVISSLLWLSETWTPTKAQTRRLDSWGARLMARVVGTKRSPMEDVGGYWRRLHRKGHACLRTVGGSVTKRRRKRLHRYAGHLARMADGMARTALRTRSLAWWRFRQRRFVSKHCGLHPKRFSALSRWEAQLTATHGEAETADVELNVGWLALASDRCLWKGREDAFANWVDA